MRVLHTADWHLGQCLNGWDRDAEHRLWFEALADVVASEEVDVLLVAGDIFDGINPSGASQELFYSALRMLKKRRPSLVTVITSGNHDPSGRLEAPRQVLEVIDAHVIACLRRTADVVHFDEHMIALRDAAGDIQAWVCAIPFLRQADLPGLSFAQQEGQGSPIIEAARRLHAGFATAAIERAGRVPVIAMGHLHCHGAAESEGAERRILIGNEHALSEDVFPEAFTYVALGHLHRPQTLGQGRIRYSGSCFPLSASEVDYDHGVTLIDVEGGALTLRHLSIPRPVQMIRLPTSGAMTFDAFEAALAGCCLDPALPKDRQPFLYVTLEATGPAAVILADAERLLAEVPIRLAGLKVRRITEVVAAHPVASLDDTQPEDLFRTTFLRVNSVPPEDKHIAAFRDAMAGE